MLVLAFAAAIAVGTVLLLLPVSSASGAPTAPLDALFTATSAVCVTGLVVVDTGTHWSTFGHVVIALLIQAGGFGFMTGSTMLLLVLVRRRTTLRDRLVARDSLGVAELGGVTHLVRRIALFSIAFEGAGAVLLGLRFALGGEAGDPLHAAWWGVFHSISAFNNAGFDLLGEYRSMTPFSGDSFVLGTIAVLVFFGGLGYAIVADVFQRRSWTRLALETKLVLAVSVALIVVGTAFMAVVEWDNPRTLGPLDPAGRVLNAAFQVGAGRTSGFNSVSTADLLGPTLLVLMALMFIGGASGSSAGGIKVTTFGVLLVAISSTVRGRSSAEAFGRRLRHEVVYRALAVALLALAAVFLGAVAMNLTSREPFLELLFETVSAAATVGLSTGITPTLDAGARWVLVVLMFVGRLGPLTLVLALAARQRRTAYRPAVESIRIG